MNIVRISDNFIRMGFVPEAIEWALDYLPAKDRAAIFKQLPDEVLDKNTIAYFFKALFCLPEADNRTLEKLLTHYLNSNVLDPNGVDYLVEMAREREIFARPGGSYEDVLHEIKILETDAAKNENPADIVEIQFAELVNDLKLFCENQILNNKAYNQPIF